MTTTLRICTGTRVKTAALFIARPTSDANPPLETRHSAYRAKVKSETVRCLYSHIDDLN